MSANFGRLLSTLLIGIALNSYAAESRVEITPFQDDKAAAITYTFDDGLRDQAKLIAPFLTKLGLRATFFVIPSTVPETEAEADAKDPGAWGGITWSRLKELANDGHEIANHSWSHPGLPKLDDTALRDEITKADEAILQRIGQPALTFCYPFNTTDDRVRAAVMENHLAARETCFGFGGPTFTTEKGNAWADEQIRDGKWGVVMIHGIVEGYDAFANAKVLEDHLSYVKGLESKVWIDTFANIARYQKERENAKLQVTEEPNQIRWRVENPLDSKIYNVPLTARVAINAATQVEASQDGKSLPVQIFPDHVLVNWQPTKDPVIVRWK